MLIAGHSNPATSMKYIHPQQDDIANALASCDELAKKKPEEGQRCPTCGQVFREGKQSL
jgi:hypothetical protein